MSKRNRTACPPRPCPSSIVKWLDVLTAFEQFVELVDTAAPEVIADDEQNLILEQLSCVRDLLLEGRPRLNVVA